MLSADNLCKQFGPNLDPNSLKLVFLKDFLDFEKNQQTTKVKKKSPDKVGRCNKTEVAMQIDNYASSTLSFMNIHARLHPL